MQTAAGHSYAAPKSGIAILRRWEVVDIDKSVVAFFAFMFIAWWRCFCLRRDGVVAAGMLCACLVSIGAMFGDWLWVLLWGTPAVILAVAANTMENHLKSHL